MPAPLPPVEPTPPVATGSSLPTGWSPNGVPGGTDVANITNNGTYTVNILNAPLTIATINLGAASGTQTLLSGNGSNLAITNVGTVRANGVLDMSSGTMLGSLVILPGGQLQFNTTGNKFLNSLNLINQGTLT